MEEQRASGKAAQRQRWEEHRHSRGRLHSPTIPHLPLPGSQARGRDSHPHPPPPWAKAQPPHLPIPAQRKEEKHPHSDSILLRWLGYCT